MKKYYITTPIYYVNDKPHIGHAYTTIACDVIARFKKIDGYQVHFLTGTDEHGQKVQKSAEKANMTPQEFTDSVSPLFKNLLKTLNIENDDFIRTTETRHKESVKNLWNKLVENGQIYLGSYSGWYSIRDEAFYTDNDTVVKDGKRIAISSGAEVQWNEEPSYFFKLSDMQKKLLEFYKENPKFIMPQSRYNEVVSFVERGLIDLSVSRTSFNWGIPVPNNEKHVMYVWLDALANYISAIGYPNVDEDMYKTFWPCDLHMVGKDILIFHAVYWPAFLIASGITPPKRVFAHGWWTNEGQKISKSLGNVIDPIEIVEKYGVDQTRYFLLREVPFGRDGDFSIEALERRINTDLANDLGNLAQRTLSMINKNFDGITPQPNFQETETKIINNLKILPDKIRAMIDEQDFYNALETIWAEIRGLNAYMNEQSPWKLKEDKERCGTILYTIIDSIRKISILLYPFMPNSINNLRKQIGATETIQLLDYEVSLKPNTKLDSPIGIFPRIEIKIT